MYRYKIITVLYLNGSCKYKKVVKCDRSTKHTLKLHIVLICLPYFTVHAWPSSGLLSLSLSAVVSGREVGYIRDMSTKSGMHSLRHIGLIYNLQSLKNVCFWTVRGNLSTWKTHPCTWRAKKCHIERNPEPSLCETTVLSKT